MADASTHTKAMPMQRTLSAAVGGAARCEQRDSGDNTYHVFSSIPPISAVVLVGRTNNGYLHGAREVGVQV